MSCITTNLGCLYSIKNDCYWKVGVSFKIFILYGCYLTYISIASVDVATRGAERFLRVYYNAYDSKDRAQNLPKFYLPTATAVWNGNPLQGADGVKKFIEKMPNSKHSIISFDCQAIPCE